MNEVEESSWREVGLDLVVLKHMDTGNTGNRLTTKGLTGIKACNIRKQGNTRIDEVEESSWMKVGLDLVVLQLGPIVRALGRADCNSKAVAIFSYSDIVKISSSVAL